MSCMVDLFAGRGGWSRGFLAYGWRCIGLDINPQPDYPGEFIQCDIAQLTELPPADFYCCSSPCEQFSVHGMRHFHPNPKWPWLGIALFNHAKALLEATGKPYIMENVRSAQKFVGRAVNHCGPFYLWGTGLPAIMPHDVYDVKKGFSCEWNPVTRKRSAAQLARVSNRTYSGMEMGSSAAIKAMTPAERRKYRKQFSMISCGSKSTERERHTALAAEIPEVISRAVAAVYTGEELT